MGCVRDLVLHFCKVGGTCETLILENFRDQNLPFQFLVWVKLGELCLYKQILHMDAEPAGEGARVCPQSLLREKY